MSRNIIIAAAATFVLLVGGAIWYVSSQNNSEEPATSSSSSQSAEQSTTSTSLTSITNGGSAKQCSMEYSGQNGNGSGQIYTDGNGRGRYTFNATTEQNNSGQINQIVSGQLAYSWFESNGKTIGFKTDLTATPSGSTSSSSSSSNSAPDPNQQFSMSCSNWNVDEAKFGLPAGVNFLDANALVPATP